MLAAGPGRAHTKAMRPRDDNVIPFRRKPRKWTRPEDYVNALRDMNGGRTMVRLSAR